MEKIKPITLEIDKELWERFKESVPRKYSLNEAIVMLIRKKVKDKL